MRDEISIIDAASSILRQASQLDRAKVFEGSTERPFEVQKVPLDLTTAMREDAPFKIGFPFRSVFVRSATDVLTEVSLKVNSRDAMQSALPLKLNDSLVFPFQIAEGYLHWSAQSGKTMDLYFLVTGEFRAGSQVSVTGGGVSIIDGSSATTTVTTLSPTTAAAIAAANLSRKVASIQNNTGADLFVGPTSSVSSSGANLGYKVPAGATFQWRNTAVLYGYSVLGGDILNLEEI